MTDLFILQLYTNSYVWKYRATFRSISQVLAPALVTFLALLLVSRCSKGLIRFTNCCLGWRTGKSLQFSFQLSRSRFLKYQFRGFRLCSCLHFCHDFARARWFLLFRLFLSGCFWRRLLFWRLWLHEKFRWNGSSLAPAVVVPIYSTFFRFILLPSVAD